MSQMREWFFLRPGFDNFVLDPREHHRILIGNFDRDRRDELLTLLDGAAKSMHGQKAVIYGDYGRGKTHLCQNLLDEIARRGLALTPIYIKCSEFTSKEKFSSFFRDMVLEHGASELRRLAEAYARMQQAGGAEPLADVVDNEEIASVMATGLVVPNELLVRRCMRWLGGEAKIDMSSIPGPISEQLTTGREFAAVIRGLSHMYRKVDKKVLLYIVDEAERVEQVSHADTFTSWKSAIREITEISGIATVFFVGAKSRNDLPVLFVHPEIMRRIGTANYLEMHNPSREQLREFLLELLRTLVRKGELPEAHWDALDGESLTSEVPAELNDLVGHDEHGLATFPFEPGAFEDFIEHLLVAEFGSKPSEALARLQKAAQIALTSGKRVIGTEIVEAIQSEGF